MVFRLLPSIHSYTINSDIDVDLYTVIRQSIGHIAFACVLKSSSGFFKFYLLFGYSNCNKILRTARY